MIVAIPFNVSIPFQYILIMPESLGKVLRSKNRSFNLRIYFKKIIFISPLVSAALEPLKLFELSLLDFKQL